MEKKRISSIQYLRGLASLGVVLCHYGSGLTNYPKLSKVFNFGQTGVQVFFLISGFIVVYSLINSNYHTSQLFRFLLRRATRIDPPYFVTILLTLVLFRILMLIPSYRGRRVEFIPWQLISHILYIIPFTKYKFYESIFWTLSVEFQFYLFIGGLYFINNSSLYKTIFLVIFSLTFLLRLPNSYFLLFTYAPVFALGISLISYYQHKKITNLILPFIFICLIEYRFGSEICLLLVAVSSIVLLVKLNLTLLEKLGDISYSLYLTHPLVLIVLTGVEKRVLKDPDAYELYKLVLEVVFAVITAYIFYILVERPSIKLSKRIFYKND